MRRSNLERVRGGCSCCRRPQQALSAATLQRGLTVRYRSGGEEICPHGHNNRHKLKKLLQQHSVVPWMRGRVPLLYAGDKLVAVAGLWLANDAVAQPGSAVEWRNGPALH